MGSWKSIELLTDANLPTIREKSCHADCLEHYRISFKLGIAHPSSALSKDVSPNTIAGDFPPNSSVTRFMLLFKASSCTDFPPAIEPVKLIFEIAACDASSAPVGCAPFKI